MFGFSRSRPATTPIVATTLPLALNLSGQEKIDHAFFRLDQIIRHWTQHVEVITAQKIAEFDAEAMVHVVNLKHTARQIVDEMQRSAFLTMVEDAIQRLRSLGWEGKI